MSAGLGEIGRRLREARLAKGISLAEVEEQTKIRRRYLEAIEAGAETVLPGDVYTKGFIRSYANFLGLDGPALVDEYKRLQREAGGREAPGARGDAARDAVRERYAAEDGPEDQGEDERAAPPLPPRPRAPRRTPAVAPATPQRARGRARPAPLRRWLVGLGLAAAALVLLWVLYRPTEVAAPAPAPPGPAASLPSPAEAPAAGAAPQGGAAPAPSPPPGSAPEPPQPPAPAPEPPTQVEKGQPADGVIPISVRPGPIRLDLAVRDRVWMRVVADGKEVLSATLQAGDSRSFSAQERIDMVLGWIDPVDVTVNGKPLGPLGSGGPWRVRIAVPAGSPAS